MKSSLYFIVNAVFNPLSELPVKWLKELEPETTCMKGQPMYLTCELNKEREVIWKRSGAILKKKAGKVAINIIGLQHAVTIQNATDDDAGAYTCEVDGQEDVKTTTNVKVIGKQSAARSKGKRRQLTAVFHLKQNSGAKDAQFT